MIRQTNALPFLSDLCELGVFARNNPTFGCGFAALSLCGDYSFAIIERVNNES
jgi:hypothetical protein